MSEITLTTIIFLTLSSLLWLGWFFFNKEPQKTSVSKHNKENRYSSYTRNHSQVLQKRLSEMEVLYSKSKEEEASSQQKIRALKGELFKQRNKLLSLSERIKELQNRKMIFNAKKTIEDLECEVKMKDERIQKLISRLALTPKEEVTVKRAEERQVL